MFKIGDFSKLGQVSTRMLRHYDKLGLLVPNQIDQWTGYRYYSVEQLAQLHRIIALKDLGLSLEQISELLKDDVPIEQLHGMLKLKHAEVQQEVQASQGRLEKIATRLQLLEQQGQPAPYEIVAKSVSAQTIASIRAIAPTLSDMNYYCESLYQQLYQGLEQHNIEPLKPEITLYHNEEYTEVNLDVEMSVVVDPKYQVHNHIDGKIIFRELPAHDLVAALIYEGPFMGISAAALSLLTWVGTHQYVPTSPMRELHLSGPAHINSELQEEAVIELQMPIVKLIPKN